MAQIPRQFLQRPQMGSVGRRDRAIARTQPGVGDQVDAIIAATRGLDLTPIGDALYKTGSAFVQMERERVAAEDELKKMKQMSAARSVIINTTQKIHDAYEEIKVQNLSDPEEARNAFHQRVQQVMDEDQETLDGIGPYAFEPYSRHITETMTNLQPKLTAQAIGNSRTLLEEQLHEQTRSVVAMAGSIEDDNDAAKMMEMQFGAILDESYGFLSDTDRAAFGKSAMNQFVAARFRKKWADNPRAALGFINAQTGIDPEVRHKIYAEVVSEANSFNNTLESQMALQDRMTDRLQTERFQMTHADLTEALRSNNLEKVQQIYTTLISDPTALNPQHGTMLLAMATEAIDGTDEKKGPSDQMAFAVDMLATQPLHVVNSWYENNFQHFNNAERIAIREKMEAKGTRQGEAAMGQYKALMGRVKDRLIALHPDMANNKDFMVIAAQPGGIEALKDRLGKDSAEKFAMLERDAMTLMDGALYTNSQRGQNYDNFDKRLPAIEDALFRQYEESFKNPSKRPGNIAIELDNEINLWQAGKRSRADLIQSITNHAKNQRNQNGQWDPSTDPVYVRAQQAIEKSKQPAVGAAGARTEQPSIAEPKQEPVHAGIIPDLAPVEPMEPARTIGKRVDDSRFEELYQQVGIGAQSAAEESSGDPGIVGNEPDGTKSYGMFQINQKNIPDFVRFLKGAGGEAEARALSKAAPGSPEFKTAWQKVAQSPEFAKHQQKYAEQEFYGPAKSAFESAFSVKAGNMPPAIQMALFSTGIQHGGVKKIIKMAADSIGEPRGASPREILQAIYEARTKYVMGLGSLDEATKKNLAGRYQREFQRGLKYLT